ncbi:hypothetical protein HAX54_038515 [Datura stramonium]|uniref:Uncharacterized protein n=1 Tax=Datura stramonium TaxID=4076 RepID=A0ABS8VJY8_DATST|nr:hypothetical protein [Datura stramonium]
MSKLMSCRDLDGPSLVPSSIQVYQTRSVAGQQVVNSHTDEGDDSLVDGSSLGDDGSYSDKDSGNEATSSPTGDSEPIREYVLKAKTPRFRDSLHW